MSSILENDPLLARLRTSKDGTTVLGGVLLRDRLGEGSTGSVYAGFHTRLRISVAVKILKEASNEGLACFLAEARLAVQVDHPNLVRVFDLNMDDSGLHFMVMEYVDGGSAYDLLQKRLKATGRPLNQLSALEIGLAAARGMAAAHAKGIIHRDLKSDNILVRRDGTVKVADLGLATLQQSCAKFRQTSIAGTIGFISPELMTGAAPSPASDIYSLGVTLYELVTGALPHDINYENYVTYYFGDNPPDPREHNPLIDAEVANLIVRCLRCKPQQRYRDAAELVAAIELALQNLSPDRMSKPAAATPAPVVMLIDDDRDILELLSETLLAHGFQPECFASPSEAIVSLAAVQPAVAIVDYSMPEMDGIALAQALRAQRGFDELPVLMMSGSSQVIDEASAQGIADYLVKPASMEELVRRLHLLVRLSRTNQQRQRLETELQCARQSSSLLRSVRDEPDGGGEKEAVISGPLVYSPLRSGSKGTPEIGSAPWRAASRAVAARP